MNKKTIKVGIIGGMGPLASASFVETLYTTYLKKNTLKEEYHSPYVYLYSEPLQTQATSLMSVNQSKAELSTKLAKNIAQLVQQEVDCIVICCFTAHALLPQLLPEHQSKICSLVTSVLEYVLAQNTPFIILCASSAKEAQVLESHPLWAKAAPQITFVGNEAQTQLNTLIKAVKDNQVDSQLLDIFLEYIDQFPEHQFIIACAELHILHKKLQGYSQMQFDNVFDPFYHVAQNIWG
ncbi:aspartate/glutamate racemase family protein [Fluoribacter gormanii]|uniref:aspartate/glutamate racemase family protein n=1 Tax=Fluoribacter gormanii TaxID=464 RepID=UPI002243F8A8|nr:aspartate/glutamate racemase family protein [Fluoribacter gormanii]MCW8469905.1 aspartate/glutamate racemase family protein [Fluoribacter gormanii]MCW8470493.1 aspartate/glutamate racemase family protein [Fluoribacter gormanii]